MNELKVLVAEDEPLIRSSIIRKIRSVGAPFSVVGEASDGEAAVQLASTLFPDIVLTDIRMPERDGLSVATHLKQSYPAIQIIVITGYDDFAYARTALRSGVVDFLVKPVDEEELRSALHRAKEQIDLEYNAVDTAVRVRGAGHVSGAEIVRAMTRYISEHFRDGVTVAGLAVVFGYSPDHVARMFEQHLGMTPSENIMATRVREAVRLLRAHPEIPVQEIAETAGFDDPGYFSRVVKRITGRTPTQIRRDPQAPG
jgi:two-component system, response regulator YesN